MFPDLAAFDVGVLADTFGRNLAAWVAQSLPNLLAAILILVIGLAVASWVARRIRIRIERGPHTDRTLARPAASLVRYIGSIIVIIAALSQLGFETTSLLAALGAAGLAIGLALQGTLSNIAAGFMLIWLRPFSVGDVIESGGVTGKVVQIDLFATELETYDGIFKFLPNATLWNTQITNFTRHPKRMVELKFGISYGDDIAAGLSVIRNIARSDPRVLSEPAEPLVFVESLDDSAVTLTLRAWAATPDYWAVRRTLTEMGKVELERAGLTIPFPHVSIDGFPPEPPQRLS